MGIKTGCKYMVGRIPIINHTTIGTTTEHCALSVEVDGTPLYAGVDVSETQISIYSHDSYWKDNYGNSGYNWAGCGKIYPQINGNTINFMFIGVRGDVFKTDATIPYIIVYE